MKKLFSLALVLVLLCTLASSVFAAPKGEAPQWKSVYTQTSAANSRVTMQTENGVNYLFLPAGVSPEAVPLFYEVSGEGVLCSVRGALSATGLASGDSVNLVALCGEGAEYTVTLLASVIGEAPVELKLTVVPTGGIASMLLVSDDPVNNGRVWVESSPDKSNKATGSLLMLGGDGTVIYDNKLTQIKGRGNSTWLQDKKPYQIKLDKKTDLLETGKDENRAKTWVLLANASDDSLLRNTIVYDLSVAMQMQPGIECRPVNLFYDGEYRGSYLLCEKVEINPGRVDIADLEKETEKANEAVEDFDALQVKTGVTSNGATYVYCEGLTSPESITGGYLLEMDTPYRATAEKCYFITTRNQYVVVKSPEYCSKEEMAYIAAHYQAFEDTIYNKGVNPKNGKTVSDYVDIDSAAQCYIINELTKNPDGYRTSSYLYKSADSDVMTMGPIWDYDLSFGRGWGTFVEPCANPKEYFTLRTDFASALYGIPGFRQAVHDIYLNTVAPLVADTLLGSKENAALQSMDGYRQELGVSARANAIIWYGGNDASAQSAESVRSYIKTRNAWLTAEFSKWSAEKEGDLLSGFIDVCEGDWYYEDITKAAQYGLVNGMNNGIFSPNTNTTRAQAAKVLFEMAGGEKVAYSDVFKDVKNTDWFAPAVLWAQKNNVVNGYEDHTFRPENSITRQDLTLILYRYLGCPKAGGEALAAFADASDVAAYAKEAMQWAAETKLLGGYEDNTVRPYNNITRAELATIIVRFYEQYVLKTSE